MQASSTFICHGSQPSTSSHKHHQMVKSDIRQEVAIAVIHRLHEWCVQLFWITVLCLMNCCGDDDEKCQQSTSTSTRRSNQLAEQHRSNLRHNLAEIELKVLRHLTSPQLSRHRPVQKNSKRRPASRPPSPQLFDIVEE